MTFTEFLSRYHQLPRIIERKKLYSISLTASYSDEPRSNNNVFSSSVETAAICNDDICILQNELRWYELFRMDCSIDEIELWDEKYYRPGTTTAYVIDRLGWGKQRYYRVLSQLEERWKQSENQSVTI